MYGEFDEQVGWFFSTIRVWNFSDVLIANNAIDAMEKLEVKLQHDYNAIKGTIVIKRMSLIEDTDPFNNHKN